MGPYAEPALHQAQQLLKPALDNLPPAVTDAITKAVHGYEPMTLVVTGAVGSVVLLRLLGVLKRFTTMVMMGLAGAYAWPYVQEHFLKK